MATEIPVTGVAETVEAFLAQARSRFRMVHDAESQLRENMLDDMQFRASEQWPSGIKSDRDADQRPCLTINRIPQFLRQVTNQQRANRPAIQVNPIDSGASVETAEALQGIIRSIEINSDADVAYATACDQQVTMGRGYWRVLTEYADDDNDEQIISIRRIPNALTVFMDPAVVRADAADARFCFILEDMPKDEFVRQYGDDALTNLNAFMTTRDKTPEWMPEGRVRVAEYYFKRVIEQEVVKLKFTDAQGKPATQNFPVEILPAKLPDGWTELSRRTIEREQVKWVKMTPCQILEGHNDEDETEDERLENEDEAGEEDAEGEPVGRGIGRDVPCKYIPVVQVLGDELNVNGKLDLRGMVRDAKDPQRMYNFWASALTEQIALAPRAPYIGVEGQFRGHETKWNNSNRKNYMYLEVKPVSVAGQAAGLPQRQQFEPAIQSMVEAFHLADNDLKAVMGLFDASLGEQGPEQSGKAILARQKQGEVGNSNWMDNLGRGIRHTGRIILDMIPRVYTPVRVLRILGVDDSKPKSIAIHTGAPQPDLDALRTAQEGIAGIYDISVGRYDVSISAGPSYLSRRQEAVASMLQLAQAAPQTLPAYMDLLVKNMDWPGATEIAERLKNMVPPQALQAQPAGPNPQQVQQMQQQLQQLQQEKAAKTLELTFAERIKQAQIESHEYIAGLNARSLMWQTEAKIDAERTKANMQAELDQINQRMAQLHDASLAAMEHASTMQQLTTAPAQPGQPSPSPSPTPAPAAQGA